MSELAVSFKNLEQNVETLVRKKLEIQKELEKYRKESDELREQIVRRDKEIEDLIEKNKILKIASGASNGDSREIKFKINEIVREVDKCIAQLNQ